MKKFYLMMALVLCALTANAGELYIFGGFNGWNIKGTLPFTENADGYTTTVSVTTDLYFAISTRYSTDGDWNWVNGERYGTGTNAEKLQEGQTYSISNKGDVTMQFPSEGAWKVTVSKDLKTIKISYPDVLYMVGPDGAWDPGNPIELNKVENEKAIYESKINFKGTGFKLSARKGDWDNDFNAFAINVGENIVLGEEKAFTYGWGVDNSIAEVGTYYVIVNLIDKSFLLSDTSTAIESVEAASAAVEYYNLQGVKVANPEKGIFIKKAGNKTTKVIL